jgi:hypothetical protein
MRTLKTKWIVLAGIAMLASACNQNPSTSLESDGGLPFASPDAGAPAAASSADGSNVADAAAPPAAEPSAPAAQPAAPAATPAADEGIAEAPVAPSQPGPTVATSLFSDALAPYGSWSEVPRYGRVWVPSVRIVGTNFRPYTTQGRWVFTDGAWNWVSSFSWGWAPFHYGRWVYTSNLGWAWVPGSQWAPAWVAWRHGHGHVGWAPLAPEIDQLTTVQVDRILPRSSWVFVPAGRILEPRLTTYVVAPRIQETIFVQTTIINRTVVVQGAPVVVGPSPRVIERYTGHKVVVQPVKVVSTRILPPRAIVVAARTHAVPVPARPSLGLSATVNVDVRVASAKPAPAVVKSTLINRTVVSKPVINQMVVNNKTVVTRNNVVTKNVVTRNVVKTTVVNKPVAKTTVINKTVISKPVVSQTVINKTIKPVVKPVATKPVAKLAAKPVAARPVVAKIEAHKPVIAKNATAKVTLARPADSKPAAAKPAISPAPKPPTKHS